MYEVQITKYDSEYKKDIRYVRNKVFIEEQDISYSVECDDKDEQATHILVYLKNSVIGTVRLLSCGRIERLSVLKEHRNKGVGKLLIEKLLDYAKENGIDRLYLSALMEAVNFYIELGFSICSDEKFEFGKSVIYMDKSIDKK